ncbi:MAG: hypothetical protein ACKPH7_11830 [Planktothrix sp.]|uniref:hypothetical protein n=2 Tax=Planktothrix sp. TaxID=3088171 RepID=UPI0038D4A3D1
MPVIHRETFTQIDAVVLTVILNMAFFRQYIAPLIVVLMFLFALFVVSARIFLPEDMRAPAPISTIPNSLEFSQLSLNNTRV